MKGTIDAAGRLVIPKEIRRQAGLGPGMQVEIRFDRGHIEIEPVPRPVKLVQQGHLLVAVPETDVPPLTVDLVQATLDRLREERGEEA
jgi:AbrB family looped-hinge helix DNA binding protein